MIFPSYFLSQKGVSWYKFHHDIALNTLTSSSHLLLNLFSFARGKELLKHQQESFSQCEIVLLNLSFFPQHPIISTVAIAGSDSCFSRYLFAALWGFCPSSLLTRFLAILLLTTQMWILFHIILIVINWLIHNMKIIRQIFLEEMFPWFPCRWDPMQWWAQVLKSKGMWCKQEIHKLISWAFRLGFRWKWVCVNGEWLLVDKLLTLLEGTHPFHG